MEFSRNHALNAHYSRLLTTLVFCGFFAISVCMPAHAMEMNSECNNPLTFLGKTAATLTKWDWEAGTLHFKEKENGNLTISCIGPIPDGGCSRIHKTMSTSDDGDMFNPMSPRIFLYNDNNQLVDVSASFGYQEAHVYLIGGPMVGNVPNSVDGAIYDLSGVNIIGYISYSP